MRVNEEITRLDFSHKRRVCKFDANVSALQTGQKTACAAREDEIVSCYYLCVETPLKALNQ